MFSFVSSLVEVMKNIVGCLPDNVCVVDPFCGSGTTGVACSLLGVEFIGIELVTDYAQIALERIDHA
jgi:site-specific DNA-methyltransferase (adenine-specific)